MSNFRLSLDFLPRGLRNQLTGLQMKVFVEFSRLFMIRKEVIALEYANVTPSLEYLAGATGSERTVISRVIHRLEELGLISIRHQRKSSGEYTVNSYMVGWAIRAILESFKSRKKANKIHQLTSKSTVLNNESSEENYLTHFLSDLREIMKNIGTFPSKKRT